MISLLAYKNLAVNSIITMCNNAHQVTVIFDVNSPFIKSTSCVDRYIFCFSKFYNNLQQLVVLMWWATLCNCRDATRKPEITEENPKQLHLPILLYRKQIMKKPEVRGNLMKKPEKWHLCLTGMFCPCPDFVVKESIPYSFNSSGGALNCLPRNQGRIWVSVHKYCTY